MNYHTTGLCFIPEQTLRRRVDLDNSLSLSLSLSPPPRSLSPGVSMPIPVIGLHNKDKVFVNGSCVLNEERFMLIGSFVAFFIPLVIMVVSYCLTIQVSGAPPPPYRRQVT